MNDIALLLLEVTVVFALALVGVRLAGRARAAVRHLILATAFGVVLTLPLAKLVSPDLVMELPARPVEPVVPDLVVHAPVKAQPRSTSAIAATTIAAAPAPAAPVSAAMWLLPIWAVVALIALVPVGASLSHLRSIRRRGYAWPVGAARMNNLAQAAGMRPPAVLLHDGIAGPIAAGILRPLIALPSSAVSWSETHAANALVHELEHVRRHDWAVHLLSRTVCALYWFHPLAWIAWRTLRLEAERSCDDAVLARAEAAAYAEQLLQLARDLSHKPPLTGVSMASGSDLSTRIKSVLDNLRPRGRAGKVMIVCTVLAAVGALALLAPLRITEDAEIRMYRAADLLAQRSDADSLAAAGLLSVVKHRDEALRLIAQASLMAPDRADLVWLHIELCEAHASCDPEPLEEQLKVLDPGNGAGWFGALTRAGKRGDEQAKSAALAAIAHAGRVDIYWTTLIARLTPPIASTRALSLSEAEIAVIGELAARAIPGYKIASEACSTERLRLMRDAEVEVCRGVADSLLNGDTIMTEMIGASMAKRAWPTNSPKWVQAHEPKRTLDHYSGFGGDMGKWVRAHANDYLELCKQHRREQDLHKAVLVAMGKNPNPAPE